MNLFDRVFRRVDIIASSMGKGSAVLVNVRGFSAGPDDNDAEDFGGVGMYGTAGVLFNPRPSSQAGNAEAIAAASDTEPIPIATRDLRIAAARGPLPVGAVSLAGYTGAHVTSLDAATGPSATAGSLSLHQPTQANSNAPHDLVLDGKVGLERITITHALGHKITLDELGKVTIASRTGAVVIQLDDAGGITATGPGGAPQSVMLATGTAAWATFVTAALGAIAAKLNAAGAVVGAPGTVPVTPALASSAASSVLKASP